MLVHLGHKILSNVYCYQLFQKFTGATKYKNQIVTNILKPNIKNEVVDLGCGPGSLIQFLNEEDRYIGIDTSLNYLSKAKELNTKADVLLVKQDLGDIGWGKNLADLTKPVILAMGLFHHLDDYEFNTVLSELSSNTNPGALVYFIDPIITLHSSQAARWFASNDRGKWIRDQDKLFDLFRNHGWQLDTTIEQNKLVIPYDTIEGIGNFLG